MSQTNEINRQIVFEHSQRPRNYGEIKNPTHECLGHNPNCGDNIRLFINISENEIIEDIRFRASGSALSKASASLMTSVVKGKSTSEALELFEQFHEMAVGKLKPDFQENKLGKLQLFAGIDEHPSRVKCATLAWHALKGAIENRQETLLTEGSNLDKHGFDIDPIDELDLDGVKCPINFVRVKVRMSKMNSGEQLRVILDEGEPIRNVPRSLQMEGHKILLQEEVGENNHVIVVQKC